MHIHILGICGTFMGGIAAIASRAGHKVTGCDANVYPPMSDQLRALGIDLIEGFDPSQLALKPDIWLIGNVVSRGNPLIEAIMAKGGEHFMSAPQWLYEHVLVDKWVAAVAGTHGKTTTTALLTWVLDQCGCHPGFLVGGVPGGFDVSARLTDSIHFVIEADEYDTAFFDKRSKFVHYHPRTVILNNLEFDHADIFADLAAIETQFHHLVRTVPNNGLLVVNGLAPALDRVLTRGCWAPVSYFDRAGGWQAQYKGEAADHLSSLFDVTSGGLLIGQCASPLPGAHNRSNILAVIAAAQHMGVRPADAIEAVGRFPGVKRRLETRGVVNGVTVIDDFAHHPTAFAVTIEALRERMGKSGRILAVLEPRSNTMKQGVMKAQLAPSLAGADKVFCFVSGVSWDAGQALAPLGEKLSVHNDLNALVFDLLAQSRVGDVLLVMSNGGFGGIHQKLLTGLQGNRAQGQPA
jgi:UDP-N-acetylmuramate: L-alanyl-gamma-D-glutamyl-meso-diaminopimelate ligase